MDVIVAWRVDGAVAVLQKRKEAQDAEKFRGGESWKGTENGHVFMTAWGGPIYPTTATALIGLGAPRRRAPRPFETPDQAALQLGLTTAPQGWVRAWVRIRINLRCL
ncbi:hypothetical protein [Streptosporangium sp. NBC_01469]|uniref:hypothetical protein n=1 Tax=Streptosporangium sp. NBC_01469 TaxID=2903898 RepID=UPI002E27BFE9|nr:hypothetical protein [Streptosporangium sp. NBC_01469]